MGEGFCRAKGVVRRQGELSGGVKALILMKHFPGKTFNASNCGDNCAKWILRLGEEQDFTISLLHVVDFG